jgi:cysteine-rich repeat protein
VDPNKPLTIMGSTVGGKDNGAGKAGPCAVGLSSPDNIYQLIPTAKGKLTVTVKGDATFDSTIYLRSSCADAQTQESCSESTGAGGTETFDINVVPGRPYFLYVDGKTGSAGSYTLTLSLAPQSFCGDGTVDTGEACDDGNNVDNDGCSPDCKAIHGDTQPVAAGASCPGEIVHVWGGAASPTVIATGTTTTYPNSWKDTDSSCKKITNVNNAPDHVYAVTVHKTGTLTVSTQNVTFNVELLARTVCTDALTTGATMCANDNNTTSPPFDETMSFAVTSGVTYFVAVDGASVNAKGDYQLTFSLP